jgi:hypothetical protein
MANLTHAKCSSQAVCSGCTCAHNNLSRVQFVLCLAIRLRMKCIKELPRHAVMLFTAYVELRTVV